MTVSHHHLEGHAGHHNLHHDDFSKEHHKKEELSAAEKLRDEVHMRPKPSPDKQSAKPGASEAIGMAGVAGIAATADSTTTKSPPTDTTKRSLSDVVQDHIDLFDSDKDGKITKLELTRAAAKHGLDNETMETIVTLERNYNDLAALNKDNPPPWLPKFLMQTIYGDEPLTMADLKMYKNIDMDLQQANSDLVVGVNNSILRARAQEEKKQELFDQNGEISPAAVQQGDVGDCSFLAPLASLATTPEGRDMIKKMIHPEGDGYTVTFGDGQSAWVEKPTPAETAIYAGNSGSGLWPAVLEKAYAKILGRKNNEEKASQFAADGCEGKGPMKTLVGDLKTFSINPADKNNEELHKELLEMSSNSVMMAAGTGANPDTMRSQNIAATVEQVDDKGTPIAGSPPVDICGHHVYCVDHYDGNSKMVYLRNPHGASQLLRLPLNTFRQAFCGFSVAKNPQSK